LRSSRKKSKKPKNQKTKQKPKTIKTKKQLKNKHFSVVLFFLNIYSSYTMSSLIRGYGMSLSAHQKPTVGDIKYTGFWIFSFTILYNRKTEKTLNSYTET